MDPYNFVAIMDGPTDDQTFVPSFTEEGILQSEAGDGLWRPSFQATALTVYRGDLKHKVFHLEKAKIIGYLSDARLVLYCRKYDKGGGWIGTPGAMLVGNVASKVRAKMRSRGKFLVGQIRHPWILRVLYRPKTGWLSDNGIRLSCQDAYDDQVVIIELQLPKQISPQTIAQVIADAVVRARRVYGHNLSDEQRAQLERGLDLPPYDPAAKQWASLDIPGAFKVSAEQAYAPAATRG